MNSGRIMNHRSAFKTKPAPTSGTASFNSTSHLCPGFICMGRDFSLPIQIPTPPIFYPRSWFRKGNGKRSHVTDGRHRNHDLWHRSILPVAAMNLLDNLRNLHPPDSQPPLINLTADQADQLVCPAATNG